MSSFFKKSWIFAVAIAMVLLMVIAIVPAALASGDEPVAQAGTPELNATNISLSGEVKLMFYYTGVKIDSEDGVDYRVKATVKAGETTVKTVWIEESGLETANKADGTERVCVKVPLAYGQQADEVTVEWYAGDNALGVSDTKSVATYVAAVKEAAAANPDSKYAQLVEPLTAMLNAGAMAQSVKDYNPENLANAGLFAAGNPVDGMSSEHLYDMSAQPEKTETALVKFVGTEVFLDSKVYLRVYLNCLDSSITEAKIYLDPANSETYQRVAIKTDAVTGYKYVAINNISPTRFNDRFTIVITDPATGNDAKYECGVIDWVKSALDSTSSTPAQKNVAGALYQLYTYFMQYTNPETYVVGPKPVDPETKKPILDKTVADEKELTAPECTHTRSYVTTTVVDAEKDGVAGKNTTYTTVCPDCGENVGEPRVVFTPNEPEPDAKPEQGIIRLAVTHDPITLNAGESKDVVFSINVSGDVNVQTLIVTLKGSNGLELKNPEIVKGSFAETFDGDVKLNIVLDGSEAATEDVTLVKVKYEVTAPAEGTYTVTPTVREATNGYGDNIESFIVTSSTSIKANPAKCQDHTVAIYAGDAANHSTYCTVCGETLSTVAHSYNTVKTIVGEYYFTASGACECGRTNGTSTSNKYHLGFSVAKDETTKEDVKTTKAPLFLMTPQDLLGVGGSNLGEKVLSKDGDYVTFHNSTKLFDSKDKDGNPIKVGKEGYFFIVSEDQGETGRYIAIKYRTTYNQPHEWFVGANNGGSTPSGSDNFYTPQSGVFVPNGEWQVMILDLAALKPDHYKADDDGKYRADYVRFDIFNTPSTKDQTFDIAYIAMSDDIMSLASFADNDVYRFSAHRSSSNVIGTYMGSTKTLNPVFDAYWIRYAGHIGGSTLGFGTDAANGNLPYASITRTGTAGDCYVSLISSDKKAYTSTSENKYFVVLYKGSEHQSTFLEGWASSNMTYANASGEKFLSGGPLFQKDSYWHFGIYSMAGAYYDEGDKNYFDPTLGLSCLRFDYYNNNTEFEGERICDLAFFGVFDTEEQAYEYLTENYLGYLKSCRHDAISDYKSDCQRYCEFCGVAVGEKSHVYPTVWSVVEGRGEDGKLYESRTCTRCGEHTEKREMFFYSNFDSIKVNGKVTKPAAGNAQQSNYLNRGKYAFGSYSAADKFNDGAGNNYTVSNDLKLYGWVAVNGGVDRIVFKIGDGAWQNTTGTVDADTGGIKTWITNNLKDVDLTSTASACNFQGGVTVPATALQAHAGETVTITFAYVPKANPGAADDPNVIIFAEVTNMFIACDHSRNANALTLDKNDPQHLSAICSVCDTKVTTGATATTNGGVAFVGGSNLKVSKAYTSKTEKYGDKAPMSFIRINSTGSTAEERTSLYSNANTYITTKRYIAMMWRSTVSSAPEISLDTTAGVQRNVYSLGGGGTSSTAPVNKWHFGIVTYGDHASYSMAGTDSIHAGARSVTLDYINGSVARTTDDYVDIAFVAFFDSMEEAWEYYRLYAAAYLSEEECQHFDRGHELAFTATGEAGKTALHCPCGSKSYDESYCQHHDFDKLTNVTAVNNDGVIDYVADCAICGATQVEVDIATPGGLQFYNPGRLQHIITSYTSETKRLNISKPILKDENGMPYLHIVDNAGTENYLFLNKGGEGNNLTGVGDYFAVMYRTEIEGPGFQVYVNTPGTTDHNGAKNIFSAHKATGKWSLAVFDFSTWSALQNEAGWVRFDFIDNIYAKGNSVDIAWAGFFATRDDANDYFAAYLNKYGVEEHNCAPAYNWKRSGDIFTYTQVCYVCGETIGEAVTGVTEHGRYVWTAEYLDTLTDGQQTFTLMTENTDANNMPFTRIHYPNALGSDKYFTFHSKKVYNVGKVFAFIYRNHSGTKLVGNEMFAKYDTGFGGGNNAYSRNYLQASQSMNNTTWSLGYFDYTSNNSFDAFNGLGGARLDLANNGANAGDNFDIAAIAMFNTVEEAIEFYDKFAAEYELNSVINRYCFNSLSVGGVKLANALHEEKSTGSTFDASGITIGTEEVKCINIGGWYLSPYGNEGYYYRVTDAEGNVSDLKFITTGTNNAPNTAINNVGKNLGYNVDLCGIHSSFGFNVSYTTLKEYEGQTVTVELIVKHNTGREIAMATIKNLYVSPIKGYISNNYVNDTKVEDTHGSAGSTYTIDLDALTDVTVIRPEGWVAISGGIDKYVYRVNGGEWVAVEGKATTAGSDIQNDGGFKALTNATANVDFRNNSNGNKIYTADLSTDYSGQTVTVEFGIVPTNAPGTEADPNAFVFATYKNVHVAEIKMFVNSSYAGKQLTQQAGHSEHFIFDESHPDYATLFPNGNIPTSGKDGYLGCVYVNGWGGFTVGGEDVTISGIAFRVKDEEGNVIGNGWYTQLASDFKFTNKSEAAIVSALASKLPGATAYTFKGYADLDIVEGLNANDLVDVEFAFIYNDANGNTQYLSFLTLTNVLKST